MRFTPENIRELEEDEIFVFGSNLEGIHMGGAARTALDRFGARMGQGVGLQGKSYAIPTMQGDIETIKPYVDQFIEFASECDQNTFLVTRIGCGIAGFKDSEIAPLFDKALDLYNVRLPESFVLEIFKLREERIKAKLTPWPKEGYCDYDLFADLVLASDAKTLTERCAHLYQSINDIGRPDYILNFTKPSVLDFIENHQADILNNATAKEVLTGIFEISGFNHRDLTGAAIGRYLTIKIFDIALLLINTGEVQLPQLTNALTHILHKSTLIMHNATLRNDIVHSASLYRDVLMHNADKLSVNGHFDRTKFLNFLSLNFKGTELK